MKTIQPAFLISCLMITACSTVTIQPTPVVIKSDPSYKTSVPFYFLGLVGEHHIDIEDICEGGTPDQMQTKSSILDMVMTGITGGIYAPKTVEVWCSKEDVQ